MYSSAVVPKAKFSHWLGIALLLLSAFIVSNLFGPVIREESRYRWQQVTAPDSPSPPLCPPEDFLILIPQLGVCTKVVKNVDPFDSRLYQRALTQGVAHAMGTGMPGDGKNIFLFAHSSGSPLDAARYNSIFYLLYKLVPGDTITIRRDGITHSYVVASLAKVNPDKVSYLSSQSNEETLTLMTCWPPGTTLKRLIVVAKPISL